MNSKNSLSDDNFNDMADSQLAVYCRDNPDIPEPMAELIKRYFPFIRSRAAKYENENVSCDDLASEGLLAFLKAVKSYDEERSSNFGAYVSVCVSNRMISLLRSADKTDKNEGADEKIELAEDNITPETICMEKERNQEIESVLTEMEFRILNCFIEGDSYSEIAQKLGIGTKSVDNAVQRIRKKLKKVFL